MRLALLSGDDEQQPAEPGAAVGQQLTEADYGYLLPQFEGLAQDIAGERDYPVAVASLRR